MQSEELRGSRGIPTLRGAPRNSEETLRNSEEPYNSSPMRRTATLLLIAVVAFACGEQTTRPESEAGERLYTLRGEVVSRNAATNTLRIQHEAIPGFMDAMTMDFPLRGADVAAAPPDGSRLEATLHVTERTYWITDLRRAP